MKFNRDDYVDFYRKKLQSSEELFVTQCSTVVILKLRFYITEHFGFSPLDVTSIGVKPFDAASTWPIISLLIGKATKRAIIATVSR